MSIKNTKLISYISNSNELVVIDKYLQTIESSYNFENSIDIVSMVWDDKNNKLWTYSSDKKIRRFDISENTDGTVALNLEATLTGIKNYCNFLGDRLAIDYDNNVLYFGDCNPTNSGKEEILIYDLDAADGATYKDKIQIDDYNSKIRYFYSIFYDKLRKKIYRFKGLYLHSDSNFDLENDFRPSVEIDPTTKEIKILNSFYNGYLSGSGIYDEILTRNIYQFPTILLNKISNEILTPFQNKKYPYNFKLKQYLWIGMRNIKNVAFGLGYYNESVDYTVSNLGYGVGNKTGNTYIFIGKELYAYDINGKLLFNKTFFDIHDFLAFNSNTEEFYRLISGTIFLYDRYGISLCNSAESPNLSDKTFSKLFLISGTSEVAPYAISPNKIVYPASPEYVSTETPTIVFEPGVNPDGWTQQFRIVFDTDLTKIINGDENTNYSIKIDSWANGEYYDANVQFQYSTDYSPGSDPSSSGTWNNLGTEDGLQSGGTVPTNGISRSPNEHVYVKFTLPSDKKLTGIDSGTTWYCKIFSYSKGA